MKLNEWPGRNKMVSTLVSFLTSLQCLADDLKISDFNEYDLR